MCLEARIVQRRGFYDKRIGLVAHPCDRLFSTASSFFHADAGQRRKMQIFACRGGDVRERLDAGQIQTNSRGRFGARCTRCWLRCARWTRWSPP